MRLRTAAESFLRFFTGATAFPPLVALVLELDASSLRAASSRDISESIDLRMFSIVMGGIIAEAS